MSEQVEASLKQTPERRFPYFAGRYESSTDWIRQRIPRIEGGHRLRCAGMSESTTNQPWLDDAKQDIGQWSASMPKDADEQPIDWQWIASLDLRHGIGVAAQQHIDLLSALRTASAGNVTSESSSTSQPSARPSAQQLHDLLKDDLAIRDRLEPVIAQCNSTFMTDFDRLIASYRLPRALAYANRRLCDEIAVLRQIGVAMGLWTITEERRERVTVPVLQSGSSAAAGGVVLDDIQDCTSVIVNARAARRAAEKRQKHASDHSVSRANLGGVTSPGGSTLFDYGSGSTGSANGTQENAVGPKQTSRLSEYRKSDWRDAYLPGRDVDNVMGIDIETTGTDPARVYIIDVGFEYMNMISPRPADAPAGYQYEQGYYEAGDAYGQSRLAFGVPAENAALGNPLILDLTGIDVRTRSVAEAASSFRLFDEWPAAQIGLLQRLEQQPYVAHNARFEHSFFMLNVAGYAESYRAGNITIIDTLPMSRRWDEGSIPDDEHPHGNNTLDAYAKRQGALDASKSERHLGLEDTHIMLVAMKHHLGVLHAEGRGPWGAGGRPGNGGKRCGKRW